MKYITFALLIGLISCGRFKPSLFDDQTIRVVENGCGRFAIQTRYLSVNGNIDKKVDTIKTFFGLEQRRGLYISDSDSNSVYQFYSAGTIDVVGDSIIQKIDTVWDARTPYEITFATKEEAQKVIDRHYQILSDKKRIQDSITNCHTYR